MAKTYKKFINESSLSRIWKHNEEHDCGALSAFRKAPNCGKGEPYTKKENLQRNKSLRAKLKSKGYGITELKGQYPEGGKVGKEQSFFIVNLNDDIDFFDVLTKISEEFDQDSVLLIPKGAVRKESKDKAYLYGTNHCDNNDIGYHNKVEFEKGKFGYTSPIYTSYVNGRPFIFEEVGDEVISASSGMGIWATKILAEKNWKDIEI